MDTVAWQVLVLLLLCAVALYLGWNSRNPATGQARKRLAMAHDDYMSAVKHLRSQWDYIDGRPVHPVSDLAAFLDRGNDAQPRS
jgi:hypothetical protein